MTLRKKWKLIVDVVYLRLATTIQKVNLERMRFCKIKTKSMSRWVNKNLELFWFAVFGSAMYVNQLPKAILRIFFILRKRVIDTRVDWAPCSALHNDVFIETSTTKPKGWRCDGIATILGKAEDER